MRVAIALVFLAVVFRGSATEIVARSTVDQVWAGHPVGFALLTAPPKQFVAYYDADRNLVVASRALNEDTWSRTTLPEKVGWDSHNYLTMALDDGRQLHLSGNMHGAPLVYFKSSVPLAATTMERVSRLTGGEEGKMTYPHFFRGPQGEFIYTYRDGSSGNGNQIYNVYNEAANTWSRLLDTPLTDGAGKRNAYLNGPTLGQDGYYHLVWVWRESPDCATNHSISYMRSRDLRHWENIRGEALALPVTLESPGVIVDPVPERGGLINGNATFGFDLENRVVVTYHKYDPQGNSQVYNARWDGEGWSIVSGTQWDTRWEFSGGGSIEFDVRVQPVQRDEGGNLVQEWRHWQLGRQRWRLDPVSLAPVERVEPAPNGSPRALSRVVSTFPGMEVRTASDLNKAHGEEVRYVLRWETLGRNRDKPREKPWPDPVPLEVVTIRD